MLLYHQLIKTKGISVHCRFVYFAIPVPKMLLTCMAYIVIPVKTGIQPFLQATGYPLSRVWHHFYMLFHCYRASHCNWHICLWKKFMQLVYVRI